MDFIAALAELYGTRSSLSFDELFHDSELVYSDWQRDANQRFWQLDRFDPMAAGAAGVGGVYLIGFGAKKLYALQVGADEDVGGAILRQKWDRTVRSFGRYGTVRATWMAAPEDVRPGILRFLIEKLTPILVKKAPVTAPVEVKLPREYTVSVPGKPHPFV